VLRRTADHQFTPSGGHVQNGTGLGPGRCCRLRAQGAWRPRPEGGRRVRYATNTGRAHQLGGVHDRREGRGHD